MTLARLMTSTLRAAAGLALCAALVVPAAAAPTALTVGPDETHLLMAMRPLGGLEQQATRLQAYLKSVGLEDPGLGELRAFVLDAVTPGRRRGPAPASVIRAMGLNPEGAFAFYVVPAGEREREVMAVDVADLDTFVKVLTHLLEKDQWVEPGEKPKKAKVNRSKGADGAQQISIALDEWSRIELRHKGGVAVLADRPEALAAMRLDGGREFQVTERLRTTANQVGFLFAMEPSRTARMVRRPEPWFASVDRLAFTGHWGPEGLDVWGEAEVAADVAEFLGVARPGPAGAKARAAMAGLVDAQTSGWLRYGLDVQAIWALAEGFLGGGLGEIEANFKKETGVALRADLVDQLTGDVLFAAQEGLADFVAVLGVVDSARAATTVTKLLDLAGKNLGSRGNLKTEWSQSGDQRLYRTRVWDGDPKRQNVRDEFVFWWGTREGGLVFGLTPQAIEATIAKRPGAAWAGEGVLADKAFADGVPLATHQVYREPLNLARQILPIVRYLMPAEQANPTGRVVRSIEAFQALYDRSVDAQSLVEIEGRIVRLRSQVRALPTADAPGWNAAADQAFTEGLRARYQGLVRTSNERLLDVSERFPGTPWARKARAYALAGDGGSNLLFILPSLSFWTMLGRADWDQGAVEAVPAYDPCDDLAARTCYGPSVDDQLCRIARAGVQGDCAAALAGGAP